MTQDANFLIKLAPVTLPNNHLVLVCITAILFSGHPYIGRHYRASLIASKLYALKVKEYTLVVKLG